MRYLKQVWLIPLLLVLAWTHTAALAADDDSWAPTPPRLGYIDGEVSYWRPGAEDWARARPNLALAEGDALYSGNDANLEVQFDRRSFVRADENTQLSLVAQEDHRIQFSITSGLASFDMRSMEAGDAVEVSTPNAVFLIEHPGYYRVEVGARDTHFIVHRGGEATVTTSGGRSLSIYPSEDIVITAGNPVQVATYAAPSPDAWDRWNDERSDRIGDSISARYLPPEVYGAEELDYHGHWRVVPTYGAVWIPSGISVGWVPYSTGYWVWDPYYEWTWVDDAPWGWAPFHYGRWVSIDGYWAWAPGPVVRRPRYSPALVGFMVRNGDVSARLSVGLPGLWWVALSWGEPVIPWWGPPRHRGQAWWGGWGGPRIVNNVVIRQTTIVNVGEIHYHNATRPRAVLTVPADRFGRERMRPAAEDRVRSAEFTPVRGELPVKPTRASLFGGAPKGTQPPREVVARPVVSTRAPRERARPLNDAPRRARTEAVPDAHYVIPPARRIEDRRTLPRPPLGAEAGPERTPPPRPPRYDEVRRAATPPAADRPRAQGSGRPEARPAPPAAAERRQAPAREQATERREVPPTRPAATVRGQAAERGDARPAPGPAAPSVMGPPASRSSTRPSTEALRGRPEAAPQRGEAREERGLRPLPGQPANQIYRGRDRDSRGPR